jgi:putative ATP-dependent endonuclease of OLD family
MKLARISIRNFRSIKELDFSFPSSGVLALVGSNNAGKSNIIRSINAICGEAWFGPDKMQDFDFYQRDKDLTIRIELSFDNGHTVVLSSDEKWPKYLDGRGSKIYDPGIKEAFPCTYLDADRSLDKHLAYTDWSLISRIRKAFHQKAAPLKETLDNQFNQLMTTFEMVPGFSSFRTDFEKYFDELQADSPAKLSLDFKPFTPSNYFKTMQILAADPALPDKGLDLSELGEGSRNVILLALLRSYAKNFRQLGDAPHGILALEEPELYLHPQARRHLAGVLREISDSGLQVIISTHSSSFVDTEFFDSVGRVLKVPDYEDKSKKCTKLITVSREDLVSRCIQTGAPANKCTVDNITEHYGISSNQRLNEGFFASAVVLCEGDSEEFALPTYLKSAGLNCDELGVSVIGVGGKEQLPKYWRLFSSFKLPVIVVLDDDDDGTGNLADKNRSILTTFDLSDDVVQYSGSHILLETPRDSLTSILILKGNFEKAIRSDIETTYGEKGLTRLAGVTEEARKLIKPKKDQAKGQMARYIARTIVKGPFLPSFVKVLAEQIKTSRLMIPLIEDDIAF